MAVNSVTSSTTNGASSESKTSSATLSQNLDTFLTLLTTQLKFQDPLEPLDSKDFVAQLVSFSQVEQAIGTNAKLDELLKFETGNRTIGALSYIGKTVEATSSSVSLGGGEAQFSYTLPKAASIARVLITDANGIAVASLPVDTTAGKHTFTWDGKNGQGQSMTDGVYNIVIAARDGDDKTIKASTAVISRVTGIETRDNGLYLNLGPLAVPYGQVISVADPQSRETAG
jgi:flagellar basal-body rod modification protein FlgD